jgi:hypothetical protein
MWDWGSHNSDHEDYFLPGSVAIMKVVTQFSKILIASCRAHGVTDESSNQN